MESHSLDGLRHWRERLRLRGGRQERRCPPSSGDTETGRIKRNPQRYWRLSENVYCCFNEHLRLEGFLHSPSTRIFDLK